MLNYQSKIKTVSMTGERSMFRVRVSFKYSEPIIWVQQFFLTQFPEKHDNGKVLKKFKNHYLVRSEIGFKMDSFVAINAVVSHIAFLKLKEK